MTTEEKAKRFDEALEQIKGLIEGTREDKCAIVEEDIIDIFPELKESEDNRVRKELINTINLSYDCGIAITKENRDRYIAWLEKQGDKSVNIDIESMVNSYKQRLKSQGSTENNPLFNMYLTAFRHGIENVLEELNLKKFESEQKPKWSGEDDYNVQCCIAKAERDITNGYLGRNKELIEWLKSLKQRV